MFAPSDLIAATHWSGVLRRKLDHDPDFTDWLVESAQQAVTPARLQQWWQALQHDAATLAPEPALRQSLRRLRQRVFYTLMVRDIHQSADFDEVVLAMSELADLALAHTYTHILHALEAVHGTPTDPDTGLPQEMLVIGMGKLGGQELNVSSDIDLIMLYGTDGTTTGRRPISHHEFYARLTQRMMPILSDADANGQVFRTDLRLRPDGDSGPPAWSLDALERYLVTQGREWERYAWIKARAIPCQGFPDSQPHAQVEALESLRQPFVYRKYFDFDALAALRVLRERIRDDWQRKARARSGVDAIHNIKLGDGGIREIEFIVQLNQLIRGGRQPSLQHNNLRQALARQTAADLIPADMAQALQQAYLFLRRTEHLLQYREDQQTHLLPADPNQRAQLADTMGLSPQDFEHTLAAHRDTVHQVFRNAFRIAGLGDDDSPPSPDTEQASPDPGPEAAPLETQLATLFGEDAAGLADRIHAILQGQRIRSLPTNSRARLDALLPAALAAAARTDYPVPAAIRLLDLIENIAQRSAYLALLTEYPDTLARVARIMGASPWAAQYLNQYPILLDSLIEWHALIVPVDLAHEIRQLQADLDACLLPNGLPDVEQQMNLLRDFQHQISFQLLAQDIDGRLTVETLADHLSALADALLDITLQRVWPAIRARYPDAPIDVPAFAVIAYGKLGGKELGYASDLDLVFIYDDPQPDAADYYTRLARRVTSWLTTLTSSGRLYDIDLRLRPDGDAGLLAVSFEAFEAYQLEHAWPWEHQALTRARFAAGDPALGQRFEALREQLLLRPRPLDTLRRDVAEMRDKIAAGHPNRSALFDIKHDPGGMVDTEFVVQFLVLAHARQHPALLGNLGNLALLGIAARVGLIPTDLANATMEAYRLYRKTQHALRLQGAAMARADPEQFTQQRATIRQLWRLVIESPDN